MGKCCSFYNNYVYYGFGIYTNSLYIFDLEMHKFNINSKKNILDNQYLYYLWHCRLGHINEIRIIKLHKEGYLILLIMNYMKLVKLVYWLRWPKHSLLKEWKIYWIIWSNTYRYMWTNNDSYHRLIYMFHHW